MSNPLVSIITYCFNGERFVHKYFEAILAQTYPNIELIFFNNGSVDKTGQIAEEYKVKLENRGVQVQLIHYKENQNTCELKLKGFEMMHGQFFFGCDSDDNIHPTYIEEMAGYLESHPEKGIVYCQLNIIQEETGRLMGIMKSIPKSSPKAMFEDMLHGRNSMFTAISYMMNKKYYDKLFSDHKIYISRYGENYQLQLPFLYNDLQGYIENPLGDYTVRGDSYSSQLSQDFEKQVNAYKGQEISILETLEQMRIQEKDKYIAIAQKRLRRDRFYASLRIPDAKLRKECYQELVAVNGATLKEHLIHYLRPLHLLAK